MSVSRLCLSKRTVSVWSPVDVLSTGIVLSRMNTEAQKVFRVLYTRVSMRAATHLTNMGYRIVARTNFLLCIEHSVASRVAEKQQPFLASRTERCVLPTKSQCLVRFTKCCQNTTRGAGGLGRMLPDRSRRRCRLTIGLIRCGHGQRAPSAEQMMLSPDSLP